MGTGKGNGDTEEDNDQEQQHQSFIVVKQFKVWYKTFYQNYSAPYRYNSNT
jgi:hypothetical protein